MHTCDCRRKCTLSFAEEENAHLLLQKKKTNKKTHTSHCRRSKCTLANVFEENDNVFEWLQKKKKKNAHWPTFPWFALDRQWHQSVRSCPLENWCCAAGTTVWRPCWGKNVIVSTIMKVSALCNSLNWLGSARNWSDFWTAMPNPLWRQSDRIAYQPALTHISAMAGYVTASKTDR